MAFQYGVMHDLQKAAVKVGALECTGLYQPDPSSCEAIKFQGRPSGFYIMDYPDNRSSSNDTLERLQDEK